MLRRGPTREVAAIEWNRETDLFRLGQWLRGRIYELRSDLSPDEKHLIYFAMIGRVPPRTGKTASLFVPAWRALAIEEGVGRGIVEPTSSSPECVIRSMRSRERAPRMRPSVSTPAAGIV